MIHQYFTNPQTCQRIQQGPLGTYIGEYAALLYKQGYSQKFARRRIGWLTEFGNWFQQHKLQVKNLNSEVVARFLSYRERWKHLRQGEKFVLKQFLALLRSTGILPPEASSQLMTARQKVENDFEEYLSRERGLSRATVTQYVPIVRCFLAELFGRKPLRLDHLCVRNVTGYIRCHAFDHSPVRAKHLVTSLRAFLRYLRHQGYIATDLAAGVPPVAFWRFSTLPKFLAPEQVQQTLNACNRRTPHGRRNYAILLLLSRLGLRAGEVVSLTLEDIRWDTGEITIHGKGGRRARLPLPHDVGQALAD